VARQLSKDPVSVINHFAVGDLMPNLTIVLDVPPRLASTASATAQAIYRPPRTGERRFLPARARRLPAAGTLACRNAFFVVDGNHPAKNRRGGISGMSSNAATADNAAPAGPESRSMRAFTGALARGRLAHAILVHGDYGPGLEIAALELAGKLLNTPNPLRHPDFFTLRPSGKARIVKVESLREFIRKLYLSASAGPRKIGVVYDADRLQAASANAFSQNFGGTAGWHHDFSNNYPPERPATHHPQPVFSPAPVGTRDRTERRRLAILARRLHGLAQAAIYSKCGCPDQSTTSDLLLGAYGLGARF